MDRIDQKHRYSRTAVTHLFSGLLDEGHGLQTAQEIASGPALAGEMELHKNNDQPLRDWKFVM